MRELFIPKPETVSFYRYAFDIDEIYLSIHTGFHFPSQDAVVCNHLKHCVGMASDPHVGHSQPGLPDKDNCQATPDYQDTAE